MSHNSFHFRDIVEAYESMFDYRAVRRYDGMYEKAVESRDGNAIRRLLKWAASLAMPRTKVKDANGKPLIVYHGTNRQFNEFYMSADNPNRMEHVPPNTAWFSNKSKVASTYGKALSRDGLLYRVFLNLENPAIADAKNGIFQDTEFGFGPPSSMGHRGFETGVFVKRAQMAGKDGAIIRNIIDVVDDAIDEFIGDDYIAFRPEQIKLAAVTYYDDGSLIPLSRRFDMSNPDMRF